MPIALHLLAIAGGFVALVWGADRFVVGAAATARNLGVAPLIVGLVVVGFGTSAPELLVSAMAAHIGSPALAVGNAIGSNITNVALVLGVAALVRPLDVHSRFVRREIPLLLLTMGFAASLLADGTLDRLDGALLLGGLGLMIAWVVREGLSKRDATEEDALAKEFDKEVPVGVSTPRALLSLVVGLAVLLGGSRGLVWGAVGVARYFAISDLVIGLTVVAVGTSLPELAASVISALRDEHDIAVGNVVGSNMFNLLGVLGLPGVIAPGPVDRAVLYRDFPVMFGVTLLFLVLARGLRPPARLGRVAGALLTACFVAYVVLLYLVRS